MTCIWTNYGENPHCGYDPRTDFSFGFQFPVKKEDLTIERNSLYLVFISNKEGAHTNTKHIIGYVKGGQVMVTGEVEKRSILSKKGTIVPLHHEIELMSYANAAFGMHNHKLSQFSLEVFETATGASQAKTIEESYKKFKKTEKKWIEQRDKLRADLDKAVKAINDLPKFYPNLVERHLVP